MKNEQVKRIARIAVLGALGAILATIPGIPIIPPIYKLDFSTLPVLLGGFAMGPIPALFIALIKDLLGLLSTSTQGVGELADFLCSCALAIPAALIYKKNRTLKGALVGMLAGILCTAVVGALANYFILIPFYVNVYHMPVEKIVSMIAATIPAVDSLPKLILLATVPFNILKGLALGLLVFLLYKRISFLLK